MRFTVVLLFFAASAVYLRIPGSEYFSGEAVLQIQNKPHTAPLTYVTFELEFPHAGEELVVGGRPPILEAAPWGIILAIKRAGTNGYPARSFLA